MMLSDRIRSVPETRGFLYGAAVLAVLWPAALTWGSVTAPAEATPYVGPVNAPDVVGGWASTHVVIRLHPETAPAFLPDQRLTVARGEADGIALAAAFAMTEIAIADVLDQYGAIEIERTMPFEPAFPDLAEAFGLLRYHTVRVPEGTLAPALVEELNQFPTHIELAELDGIGGILGGQILPNDPSFNQQYGLHNIGQTVGGVSGVPGADISAPAAWALHTGTDEITIAIIDTGIAASHPDLSDKVITGYNSMTGSSSTGDSWLIPHGTHVAGIAAASTNNGTGIAGVSWGARLMPIKVLNVFGGGNETDIANGVTWAADNGAHVGNMSLGVPTGISFFLNACNYAQAAGMLLVAASGNTPGALIPAPAQWDSVMCVGATTNTDALASFTTTGAQMSVTAPGHNVYSTWMGFLGLTSTYSHQSGTSMASPHVAGLAALVWSANLSLTGDQVWAIIEATADDLGSPGWNPQFGHGRVNAHQALLAALDFTEPCSADINCDGEVNVEDLLLLLAAWGECANPLNCPEDLNGDGRVDVEDLLILLAEWG